MERQVRVMGDPLDMAASEPEVQELVRLYDEHSPAFYRGDPHIEDWLHDAEVSIHGGFDVSARGWDTIEGGLRFASGRLSDGEMAVRPIAGRVVGDMGYVAGFEEGIVRVDSGERRPMRLRATMVFLRVDGDWKVIHRHGEILTP